MSAKTPLKAFALSSAALALGAASGAMASNGFSDDVVRIGVLTDMSGIYTDLSGEA
ncbi:MAG: ABC transporter permease, partial [Halomonas sp.]